MMKPAVVFVCVLLVCFIFVRVWTSNLRKQYVFNRVIAYQAKGVGLEDKHDFDGAANAYREALRLDSNAKNGKLMLAVALQRGGKTREAKSLLATLAPSDPTARRILTKIAANPHWFQSKKPAAAPSPPRPAP